MKAYFSSLPEFEGVEFWIFEKSMYWVSVIFIWNLFEGKVLKLCSRSIRRIKGKPVSLHSLPCTLIVVSLGRRSCKLMSLYLFPSISFRVIIFAIHACVLRLFSKRFQFCRNYQKSIFKNRDWGGTFKIFNFQIFKIRSELRSENEFCILFLLNVQFFLSSHTMSNSFELSQSGMCPILFNVIINLS